MERTKQVSLVSGRGGMLMGVSGLIAGTIAIQHETLVEQLSVWLYASIPAASMGGMMTLRKAQRLERELVSDAARRFLWCLTPNLVVGAMLTAALWSSSQVALLPGSWLLLYGAALLAAGTYAVPPVFHTGVCFVLVGAPGLALPQLYPDALHPQWANAVLSLAFGSFHLLFGWKVHRHYGG